LDQVLVPVVMLLTRNRPWCQVIYFWALAGAMQAIVTSDTRPAHSLGALHDHRGRNYVFINEAPKCNTLIDVLVQVFGPWPW
jgi:uncharacterized membrane protein YwaF